MERLTPENCTFAETFHREDKHAVFCMASDCDNLLRLTSWTPVGEELIPACHEHCLHENINSVIQQLERQVQVRMAAKEYALNEQTCREFPKAAVAR